MRPSKGFKITSIILLVLIYSATNSFGQEKEEKLIMKTVNNVFEAMRTNDSTLLKSCFTENPNTFTVYKTEEGLTDLRAGNFQQFIDAVGRPKQQIWNEPIWNEKVEIDGTLASVWVDYAFFIDDQFSHCGVDAFHLIKSSGSWKIFHLADTRRKKACIVPEEFKP